MNWQITTGKPLVNIRLQKSVAPPAMPLEMQYGVLMQWEANYIAENLRETDRVQVLATSPDDPLPRIVHSASVSRPLFTARMQKRDGDTVPWRPVAVFGVAPWPTDARKGIPWMLGTTDLDRMPLQLFRTAKWFMHQMTFNFAALENYVLASNARECAMLERIGFTVDAPAPWGYRAKLFRRFHWERDHV